MQNYKKKAESFRVKLIVEKTNWTNPDGDYGIYKCSLAESPEKEIKTAYNGTFNMKGNVPYDLKTNKSYVVYLFGNPEYNDKYRNYTYTIDKFETEQLTLPEEQFEFLSTVTTEAIYKQLEDLYRDQPIIDLIFEDKIDLTKVNGLKEKTFEKLKEKLDMYRDLGKLQNMLKPLGVTIRSIKKIATHFGSPDAAYYTLQKSLYNLCEVKGFGFAKVDEIALKAGTEPTDELRIKYCLGYLLEQGANDGHSWSYKEELKVEALDLLQIEPHYIDTFYENNPYEKGQYYHKLDIIVVGELVSMFGMYYDERNTLDNLDRIVQNYVPMSDDETYFNQQIDIAQEELGIVYTEEQRETILTSLKHGVVVIEGLAGTGKTTVLKAIVRIQQNRGVQCMAVALSGKAANIMSSKGLNAGTIHRTLGYNGDGFHHDSGNPLPFGLINLDEAGMASASLWNSLVSAIPSKGQFIVSGDSGQLAAIGAGDVMRDILASKRYVKCELKQIHRQAMDSGVIEVAHKVRYMEQITGYNHEMNQVYGKNEDLQIITQSKPKKDEVVVSPFMTDEEEKEAANPIYVTVKRYMEAKIAMIKNSLDPEKELLDFQILCPTKVGALGVDSLNRYAQHLYNDNKEGIKKGNVTFKKNDKVIVNGNKYQIFGYSDINSFLIGTPMESENYKPSTISIETDDGDIYEAYYEEPEEAKFATFDLFNGTMGIIKGVYPEKNQILIKFEGIPALIAIHEDDLDALDLGYAITVHKSQGSSIPNVLFTFDFGAFKLLSKQLIYTALTRTSTGKCIVICENNALLKAVSIDASGYRRTFMSLFLQHLDAEAQEDESQ